MTQMTTGGLEFIRHGKVWQLSQLRLSHASMHIESNDGDFAVITPDTFRSEIVDGYIQLMARDSAGVAKPVPVDWKQCESERAKEERYRRTQIISYVESEIMRGFKLKAIVSSLQAVCVELGWGKSPCERTVRNWRNLASGHESSVSPAWERCGNRKQGADEILLSCIAEVVQMTIVRSDRFTMTATWKYVEALYDKRWRKQMGSTPIPNHSIEKLKSFIKVMPWAERAKLQLDGRTARAITRTAVARNTAEVLWEVVEIDATVLDILIRDEEGNEIGRPVLYVAIDVATGYIVGLHLTIHKPSALPLIECLRFMLFPKPENFDQTYQIKNRIEVFGKPILMRVDNGSEFIGMAATEHVRQLFGDTARCQPYRPEQKPHVERFNGTLKTYIVTLRGATTSSVTGEKRVPPKNEKLFTIEELRGKIYRFVYDSYSMQSNHLRSKRSGKAVGPFDIVRHMKENFAEPVPVCREEFERSLCFKRQKRNLALNGISFDGYTYHSEELELWYGKVGATQCEFLYSDLDVTTIYIESGLGQLIAAFEKDWVGLSVDRASAKRIKKQLREERKELDRRTYEHKLAELRAIDEDNRSSRSRSKTARTKALVEAAVELQMSTVPRLRGLVPSSNGLENLSENSSERSSHALPKGSPKGRKMGEKE